jgi:hypothetical protein
VVLGGLAMVIDDTRVVTPVEERQAETWSDLITILLSASAIMFLFSMLGIGIRACAIGYSHRSR